ncbi:hypothetical protein ON010_g9380 [Phytophthora cinnamomi]|nr:hypothetical protein ON010_g9380 [Phytophthora cinnamomi]
MFVQLPEPYKEEDTLLSERGIITTGLKERFDFVYGDAHGVAYLLGSTLRREGMGDTTRESVLEFISIWHGPNHEGNAVIELMQYLAIVQKQPREVKFVKQKRIGVHEFWCGLHLYPLLRKVSLGIFSTPCSSAATERNFSVHKSIHSHVRNHPSEENVEKHVFIFFNTKNMVAEEIAGLTLTGGG